MIETPRLLDNRGPSKPSLEVPARGKMLTTCKQVCLEKLVFPEPKASFQYGVERQMSTARLAVRHMSFGS